MMTASADSSGDGEKWRMELSQSYSSSDLDYSDSFEPFSEEEEACWQRESEPSELYCSTEDLETSAVSDRLESISRLAGQNHAEIPELLEGELNALRSFCTIKINKMRRQLISKQADGGKSRRLRHGFTAKKPERSDLNCIVPDQLVNRIRLKNVRETVKQVIEAQIHDSSMCPDCQKKEAELAKITFLRQKKNLMEHALIQEKLEEQIYSRDVLTRIGEALRSFPKPSEDPRNLWERLKGAPPSPSSAVDFSFDPKKHSKTMIKKYLFICSLVCAFWGIKVVRWIKGDAYGKLQPLPPFPQKEV